MVDVFTEDLHSHPANTPVQSADPKKISNMLDVIIQNLSSTFEVCEIVAIAVVIIIRQHFLVLMFDTNSYAVMATSTQKQYCQKLIALLNSAAFLLTYQSMI